MHESSIPSEHRCVRYTPGHCVHWVQARQAWMDKHISELPHGEIVSLESGIIVVATDGNLVRYRNHDVERLKLIVADRGAQVALHERWNLMKFGSRGHYCICIANDEGIALTPCVDPAAVPQPTSVAEFVDQSLQFGGANLDLNQLRRQRE